MGKISPVSAKYIVHSTIQIEGVVDRPDVIGAIFGQTEGLLGADLELRELQRSGRIGRIEVKTEIRSGKTVGEIIVPSSLDKAETAIVGAALETIQRIGPCNSKVRVEKIEDVRVSKRIFVIERAKELLRELTSNVLPDSQEITDEVAQSVRIMEITEYGKDRLPAGPAVDESEEVIVVEGRADILNLLKHGIKNCIALNGTNVPETIIELGRKKVITLFVDGDRGGDLIIKEVSGTTEIDYVCKAPDGKEVEEITKKEIHKALRGRVAVEQMRMEDTRHPEENGKRFPQRQSATSRTQERTQEAKPTAETKLSVAETKPSTVEPKPTMLSKVQKDAFKQMLEDLIGTRGAYILDQKLNILGKVPTIELASTLKSLKSVFAVIFDGTVTTDIVNIAERTNIRYIVSMNSKVMPGSSKVEILTSTNL
ncbi:MAG: DNA primase DnaG [Nanoarchaeota archaeon]|nr:DNA primase DnaG [Nanoarchaeota archaeon]